MGIWYEDMIKVSKFCIKTGQPRAKQEIRKEDKHPKPTKDEVSDRMLNKMLRLIGEEVSISRREISSGSRAFEPA